MFNDKTVGLMEGELPAKDSEKAAQATGNTEEGDSDMKDEDEPQIIDQDRLEEEAGIEEDIRAAAKVVHVN